MNEQGAREHSGILKSDYSGAAVAVICLSVGLVLFFLLFRGTPPLGLLVFAILSGVAASSSLMWVESRPYVSQLITTVGGALSVAAAPSLVVVLFFTAFRDNMRRQALIYTAALLGTVCRVGVWVFILAPDLPSGIGVWIVLAQVVAFAIAVAGGSYARAIRKEGDLNQARLRLEIMRQRDEQATFISDQRREVTMSLHDSIGQRVALLHIYASALSSGDLLSEAERAEVQLTLLEATRGISEDLQRLLRAFGDDELSPGDDLNVVYREKVARLKAAADRVGISFEIDARIDSFAGQPHPIKKLLVSFLTECMTNSIKHGGPGVVLVHASQQHGLMTAIVSSPLRAVLSEASSGARLGLSTLESKAAGLGGAITHQVRDGRFVASLVIQSVADNDEDDSR